MFDLTLHFLILSGGRDDFVMLNRNASAANLIRIKPAFSAVKGGPEPSNFEDLCLVNVSVKYFSKLRFGSN